VPVGPVGPVAGVLSTVKAQPDDAPRQLIQPHNICVHSRASTFICYENVFRRAVMC
jgi:hypothetical protein